MPPAPDAAKQNKLALLSLNVGRGVLSTIPINLLRPSVLYVPPALMSREVLDSSMLLKLLDE